MPGKIILLLSIHNDSGVPERGCYIVLRCTRAAGNDHCGPSCLQDSTEYCRFRFHMQADANGKPGEWLRLAKLLSQSLKELLMEFCPANLLQGIQKIRWAELHQQFLQRLRQQFSETKPFAGLTIGICLHVEPKTAVLCTVLQAGGATVVITGSPGTTKNDVAAALRHAGVIVYGQQEDDLTRHQEHIRQVLSHDPHLLLDNGADLVATYLAHPGRGHVIASTEETTTGANRLRGELRSAVALPIIVINDSPLKLIMENEHGVGPTIVEGFMRETNLLVQSRSFVVFGYGSVGRGIARCLRRLGGRVTLVELDPIRALEAVVDGMRGI